VNRTQLDELNTAAIRKHNRNIVDSGGKPPQALLDDLWYAACEFAASQVAQAANPAPVVIAASTEAGPVAKPFPPPADPPQETPRATAAVPGPSARTRTRTRGGAK
jgi:hypothetical protein